MRFNSVVFSFSVILILSTTICDVSAEFEDILKLCDNGECELSESEYLKLTNTKEYRQRLYHLMTSGVLRILWDHVRAADHVDQLKTSLNISQTCANNLNKINAGLNDAREWAFRFIDASAKTPAGLLDSTVTSLGSYDECLAITVPDDNIVGQYCFPDLFPMRIKRGRLLTPRERHDRATIGHVNLGDVSVFRGFAYVFGICVPNGCSSTDVRSMLNVVLEPYLLSARGALNCDTAHSISYETRAVNMTKHQIVSIIFIGILMTAIAIATGLHLLRMGLNNFQEYKEHELIKALSIVENTQQLFLDKDSGARNIMIDTFKFSIVFFGTLGHAIACLEIPISYFTIDTHIRFNTLFGSKETQPLFNEAGLNAVTFVGGVASYAALIPLARSGRLPYAFAVFDRWVRFIPSIMTLTALEFIWPLLWSGPFFTRVADFTLAKCTKTWWHNAFFINNFYPVIDICGGHLFSSAMDMQMFILGLIATCIFVKVGSKQGITFSLSMIGLGLARTAWNSWAHETTATLMTPDPIPIKIVEYLNYIHMSTFTYLPSYFIGFIVGHVLGSGVRLPVEKLWHHGAWIGISQACFIAVNFANGLYNSARVIPHSWAPLLINFNRTTHTLGVAVMFLHFSSLSSFFGYKLRSYDENNERRPNKNDDNSVETSNNKSTGSKYSVVSALLRLSFSVYMSNYLLIRSEFFGRKSLYPFEWYLTTKRVFASGVLVLIVAYIFHVLCVAPFNSLRRMLFEGGRQRRKLSQKQE